MRAECEKANMACPRLNFNARGLDAVTRRGPRQRFSPYYSGCLVYTVGCTTAKSEMRDSFHIKHIQRLVYAADSCAFANVFYE